jgi:cytochrome c oxidase subunit 1
MSQAPTQMNQRMSQQAIPNTAEERRSYLAEGHSLRSWLLTTDHKRIAILFLIAITFFFLCGGIAAALHGIIMVWFFLIPSIPTTFGNFLVPMMIGARDLAFPRLNLLSWYIFVLGGLFTLVTVVAGGVDTGWTFYTPFSSTYSNSAVFWAITAVFVSGFSSILTGINFIVTVHKLRCPGMTWGRLPLFVWAWSAS